jgi:hypothetical protein
MTKEGLGALHAGKGPEAISAGLVERLAGAITDDEAQAAILDAVDASGMAVGNPDWRWRVDRLIRSDSAGWLGIGMLMTSERDLILLHLSRYSLAETDPTKLCGGAHIYLDPKMDEFNADAVRLDCALVIAALRARASLVPKGAVEEVQGSRSADQIPDPQP